MFNFAVRFIMSASKAFWAQVFFSLAIIVKVAVGAEVLDSFPGMRDLNPESDPDR